MRVTATSIPTPRPDTLVTASAVENPGRARTRSSWSSDSASAWGSTSPSRCARSRIRARSMPRPSSLTLIATLARSRTAVRTISPSGGLPRRRRSAGVSMPWSTALRSRCSNGSPSSSRIARSSSISFPSTRNATCLSSSRARSRTRRGKRSNTCHTGVMRAWMIPAWRSAERREIWIATSSTAGSRRAAASSFNRPRTVTSSPIRSISSSRRRRSTRMCRLFSGVASTGAPAGAGARGAAPRRSSPPTDTCSTSPASRTARSISAAAAGESSRKLNRPSKSSDSNAAWGGVTPWTTPSPWARLRASSARPPLIGASARSVTSTSRPAPGAAGGSTAAAAREAGVDRAGPARSAAALSRSATTSATSSSSSRPTTDSSTAVSSASRARNRSCSSSSVAGREPRRSRSSRFSVRWAISVTRP